MKRDYHNNVNTFLLYGNKGLARFMKASFMAIMMLLTVTYTYAQSTTTTTSISGGWDYAGYTNTTTLEGYADKTNGVVQLANATIASKDGAFVSETSSTYNPATSDFSQCYKVFFGCPPPNDNIGGPDQGGDGMAFSFTLGSCSYNLTSSLSGGGGLGYMNACPLMITLEFDTYSSQGTNTPTFDKYYGGGTSGNNDEISLHFGGDASDNSIVTTTAATNTNAGNLEDGMEHNVCISYIRATHILSVTIDGVSKFSYDLTGSPYDLPTYFGAGAVLNQTWSAGKQGAVDIMMVSNGAGIFSTLGGSPCPSGVAITSPSNGATIATGCAASPITVDVTATPPTGFTVTSVDIYVDGISIGHDVSAPYTAVYSSPTNGSHVITSTAHFSDGSNPTATAVNITVGGGLLQTTTLPVIDGVVDAVWASYASTALTKKNPNPFTVNTGLAANYKIMWTSTHLYVLVEVTDAILYNDGSAPGANAYNQDGVEIFLDIVPSAKTCGSYNTNEFQYEFNWKSGQNGVVNDGQITEYKHNNTGAATFAQGAFGGGYLMEIAFTWNSLVSGFSPTAGGTLGFDIEIDDDDQTSGSGTRTNQLGLYDGTFGDYANPCLFGALQYSNCNPLPVTLVDFNAAKQGAGALVTWETADEQNSAYFIVEKSTDGVSFEPIGKVNAAGNSSTLHGYSFEDPSIASGVTYYKLAQYDTDGVVHYSTIKTVSKNGLGSVLVVPNPNNGTFAVLLDNNGEVKSQIGVVNGLGQLVYEGSESTANYRNVNISELASGIYYLHVNTESDNVVKKIIKE